MDLRRIKSLERRIVHFHSFFRHSIVLGPLLKQEIGRRKVLKKDRFLKEESKASRG